MAEMNYRPFKKPNNVDILNNIRRKGSPDYQRRIPEATKANVQDTIQALLDPTHRPQMNEFLDALINRIGLEIVRSILWTNPLAMFKRGMLTMGETIEEINIGLLEARRYDPDRDNLEKDIFGAETPDVQASYHHVNRRDWYKLTVKEPLLRQAFNSEFGLSNFLVGLMTTPTTSANWDEFLLMTSLFREYYDNGGFFKVQVPDLSDQNSDGADSRFALRRLRELSTKLGFISTHYNAQGVPTAASKDELVLFVTASADAAMDVEALAAAFNLDKMDFAPRKIVIPDEHMNIPGAQAILTVADFFVVADQRIETLSAVNPVGLLTNYFLHIWQVISASLYVPAILLTTEEGTVIEIEETPVASISTPTLLDNVYEPTTTLQRGELHQVVSTVTTAPADGANDAIRYEIAGELSSARTRISQTGALYVSLDENATQIVVNVYAVDDNDIKATATFNVVGDKLVGWPDPHVDEDDDNDGIFDVTPEAVTLYDTNKVDIPTVEGVQYRKTVNTGVTFTDAGDIVTLPSGNQVKVGDKIKFGAITGTTGIVADTEYYVKSKPGANTLTLSATPGGSTLVLTTNGSAASATFDVADGSTHTVAGTVVFTAIADPASEYELAPGATASWSITV